MLAVSVENRRAMTDQPRRLSDRILAAFDLALEQRNLPVAEALVRALDLAMTKEGGPGRPDRRAELGPVAQAYEKLRKLQSGAA
jgi:hypothetical protein